MWRTCTRVDKTWYSLHLEEDIWKQFWCQFCSLNRLSLPFQNYFISNFHDLRTADLMDIVIRPCTTFVCQTPTFRWCPDWFLSVTSHINWYVAWCLINVVYLTACAFIRSWWRCTFWMTSLMTMNQHKIENNVIIAHLKSETMGKLINRIPGSRLLISSLPGSALRTHVESLVKPSDVNKHS